MDTFDDEKDDIDRFFTKDKTDLKEKLLDDNFKNAEKKKKDISYHGKIQKKRFFRKTGLLIIIIVIFSLLIQTSTPWMYIRFEEDNQNHEIFFDKSFKTNSDKKQNFSTFFKSENSIIYTGLSADDFTKTSYIQTFLLVILLLFGIIYTIFEIINKKKVFPIDITVLFQSISAITTSLISIFLILINIKFLAANILTSHNIALINQIFSEFNLIFLVPLIFIFIFSILLKISITILKINYRELEAIIYEIRAIETFKTNRYGGR